MNFQFYVEKFFENNNFKKFQKENPNAFPCSCFFVIDKKGKDNKQHFDYFIPSQKKIVSFELEEQGKKSPIDLLEDKIPSEIDLDQDFNFEDIEKLILKKMEKENIKNKIEKMLFSMQKIDNKNIFGGTIFLSMMGLLQIQIDIKSKKILSFEKKSFFDIIKFSRKKDGIN